MDREILVGPDGAQDLRWWDWRLKNWGVKWDLDNTDVSTDTDQTGLVEFTFDTPWGPPEEICKKLRQSYPKVDITWFYDEPGMAMAGYL